MGTAVRPAETSPGRWDAFADIDVFVDEVLAELAAVAKDGVRPMRSGPKPTLAGATLRKAVMAIWCVCFCGMQWRAIGLLCDIPFGTLGGLFARWTRLGLWRRMLNRLRRTWRRACRDAPEPSAVNKYGFPLAIDVSPANRHTKGIVPVLSTLAEASRAQRSGISAIGASGWPKPASLSFEQAKGY